MLAGRGRTSCAFAIFLGIVSFLVWRVTHGGGSQWPVGLLAITQITAVVGLLTVNWMFRYRALLLIGVLTTAATIVIVPGVSLQAAGLVVAGCCHAVAYISLLAWFAMSLRPNHEPVVTGIARRIRRTMPDKVVRYTRQVTIAWCVFFTAQVIVSLGLLVLAPPHVWSAFVNLLNLPLLLAMGAVEFVYRLILFRHEPHGALFNTLSALRRTKFTAVTRS